MIFFSGFSLRDEAEIFGDYLGGYRENPYVVAGFSYGAIKAVEYAALSSKRIDKIILLSPAYFVGKSRGFVKAQLLYFRKDADQYLEKFFQNAAYPSSFDLTPFRKNSSEEELEELLTYPWDDAKLRSLLDRGIRIETYLGGEDRIVDTQKAHLFFRNFSTSYYFKPFGHLLR